jgi:hypothetical protein
MKDEAGKEEEALRWPASASGSAFILHPSSFILS